MDFFWVAKLFKIESLMIEFFMLNIHIENVSQMWWFNLKLPPHSLLDFSFQTPCNKYRNANNHSFQKCAYDHKLMSS